ncbi:MAG: hypothetical protein V4474_03740 [Patescibacteria group bacterium]
MRRFYLIAGVLVLVASVATLYWFGNSAPQGVQPAATAAALPRLAYESPPVPVAPPLASPRTPPKGYAEFRNEFYKFQLFYPSTFTAKLIAEKGSAATVTFAIADRSKQFQIFILPYGGATVTPERFKRDVPSGVMNNATDISVGGATASSFESSNTTLGDVREVWFINRGFLYEVTAPLGLSAWLIDTLQSWQFL